jgi:hypothetical protein
MLFFKRCCYLGTLWYCWYFISADCVLLVLAERSNTQPWFNFISNMTMQQHHHFNTLLNRRVEKCKDPSFKVCSTTYKCIISGISYVDFTFVTYYANILSPAYVTCFLNFHFIVRYVIVYRIHGVLGSQSILQTHKRGGFVLYGERQKSATDTESSQQ